MMLIDKHSWNRFRNHNSHRNPYMQPYKIKPYRFMNMIWKKTDIFPNHLIFAIEILCCVFVLRSWRFVWMNKVPVAQLNCYWSVVNTFMQTIDVTQLVNRRLAGDQTWYPHCSKTAYTDWDSQNWGPWTPRGLDKWTRHIKTDLTREKFHILVQVWPKFVPNGPIVKTLSCVYVMALWWANSKPFYEPSMMRFMMPNSDSGEWVKRINVLGG